MNPFSREISGGSCGVLGGGTSGLSVCGLAGSSGVAGVCGSSVFPWSVSEREKALFRFLKLNLLYRSPFLSPESVKPSLWKVKET